jgi:hypothetical protein
MKRQWHFISWKKLEWDRFGWREYFRPEICCLVCILRIISIISEKSFQFQFEKLWESDQRTQFCLFALHKETELVLAISKLHFALFKIKMQVKKSIKMREAGPSKLLYVQL